MNQQPARPIRDHEVRRYHDAGVVVRRRLVDAGRVAIPYRPVRGGQIGAVWLALGEVRADSGAVAYVEGSRRRGEQYRPPAFAGDDRYKVGPAPGAALDCDLWPVVWRRDAAPA